ncbi:MAG TPA: hypothetical protein VFT22_43300 [Kofleriaceae bacterium]|nr:hypothetical protein [Kofleriaceae bacterium]
MREALGSALVATFRRVMRLYLRDIERLGDAPGPDVRARDRHGAAPGRVAPTFQAVGLEFEARTDFRSRCLVLWEPRAHALRGPR